jgi:hypothetical protein
MSVFNTEMWAGRDIPYTGKDKALLSLLHSLTDRAQPILLTLKTVKRDRLRRAQQGLISIFGSISAECKVN